jgi:2-polyprenyl-3-methyl-5-hydroxy-6-metoxy-1,4-benzoquinol methylase
MNLTHRSYKKELLDDDHIPFEDIKKNMQELNVINTWLGGHSITIKGLQKLAGNKKELLVCEIGCGGGDNLVAITKWCDKKNISIQCMGIDIKQECIEFAKQNDLLRNFTKWICSDYKNVKFDIKPDIIFSSLFCHHFAEEELIQQMRWLKENSVIGFFINDLERNAIAYSSIKILTTLFSKSYLVKNDAPLSVARGMKKNEWERIMKSAGIKRFEIQWQWAFRYLITSINESL